MNQALLPRIDWSRLDAHLFVALTADILAGLGFVDVLRGGRGPDGGLDLFATELLPYATKGPVSFVWGVQCKFSAEPHRSKGVTVSDIRDVEGLLRASRFRGHSPHGYMLVTNRGVTNTVIDRLHGIDQQSRFRTSVVDGAQLEQLLSAQDRVVSKFFAAPGAEVLDLGTPIVVVDAAYDAEGASLSIDLRSGSQSVTARALLDTGASITVVPRELISQLGAPSLGNVQVSTGVRIHQAPTYILDVVIGTRAVLAARVLALDVPTPLLGRDLLSHFVVLIDGPHRVVKVWNARPDASSNQRLERTRGTRRSTADR
jgi:predicted aspartyl protease